GEAATAADPVGKGGSRGSGAAELAVDNPLFVDVPAAVEVQRQQVITARRRQGLRDGTLDAAVVPHTSVPRDNVIRPVPGRADALTKCGAVS
ncbi:hypothetical protein, partial [Streptomyces misionensis]|uniref:hypothetical protein n=1 Tax=Streptomyces misionensis TaxID=67331 RepID=UPI0036CCED8E